MDRRESETGGQVISLAFWRAEREGQELYAERLRAAVQRLTELQAQIHVVAFNIACAGTWYAWDQDQPIGTVFHVDREQLVETGDPNVLALLELDAELARVTAVLDNGGCSRRK